MFARQLNNAPVDDNHPAPINLEFMSTEEWKELQHKVISIIYPAIQEHTNVLKEAMVKSLNRSRRVMKRSVPAGTTVMLVDHVRKDKFEPKYIGPYTIVRRARNGAYVLRDLTGDLLDRHVPVDQLKVIKRSVSRRAPVGEVFEIDRVVNHRGTPGHYEYLVRWKGYDANDDTWEPEAGFLDTQCIRTYWREQPQPV